MTSRDYPTTSSSSNKYKSEYKRHNAEKKHLEAMSLVQSRIASGMSIIIQRMVNKNLQNECLSLLYADDLDDVEGRIYFLLQLIDMDIEKENLQKQQQQQQKNKRKSRSNSKPTQRNRNSHNVCQQSDDDTPTTSKRARY